MSSTSSGQQEDTPHQGAWRENAADDFGLSQFFSRPVPADAGTWPADPGYLGGGPAGFGRAVRSAFSHMFTYRGRASRSAFWWFAPCGIAAYLLADFAFWLSRPAGIGADIVLGLPVALAGIALAVRRLHDTGRPGGWWWIGLVPAVGWIVLLVFYLRPGTPGPNRYGAGR